MKGVGEKRIIQVCFGDDAQLVGELRYERQGQRESVAFAYAEQWLTADDRFQIDPGLPLVQGFQFHKRVGDGSVFPGAIADSEPDGWGRNVIMRDHAKRRERARREKSPVPADLQSDLDYLLAVDDAGRLGALRYRDEQHIFQASAPEGRRRAPPLIELGDLLRATSAVDTDSETEADLAYLRRRGTSLGGQRPKCSILDDDGHLAIGKFPSKQDSRAVTKAEVLAMTLAKRAGITAADVRLIDSDGIPVVLVRRFDRRIGGGRIGYCSAATMLGASSDGSEQSYYTQIVDAIRVYGLHAQRDIEELWRRIVFSVLINNVDDHLHNHGFLYAGNGLWNLSPAFDINPSPDRVRELKTWISEDTGPESSLAAAESVVPYFHIKPQRAKQIIAEVEAAVATWRDVASNLGMTAREISDYEEAFVTAG